MYLVFVYKEKICIVFKSRGVEFLKFHLSLFAIYTVGLKKKYTKCINILKYKSTLCIICIIYKVWHIGENDENRRKRKVKKKLVAFLMAVCMAVPSVGTVGATVEAADREEAKVIDVTKYGADPTGATDSTPAIKKAIEAAKKVTKKSDTPVVIDFPEGRYDIYPDQAEERELYISNTVGTNQTYKDKKIGILIEDMDNVTVEGNDSLFMFHGKMTTFASIDSENVTFQNFEVDFQVPTVIDMTAVKKEGNEVTYYIPECYNYQVNGNSIEWMSDKSPYTDEYYWTYTFNGSTYSQIFDTKNGQTWRKRGSDQHVFNNVSKIEDLGNHQVKITYSSMGTLEEGFCYQLRDTTRDHAGTFFWQSKDVNLNNLDIRFIHGFGMVGQFSENITMKDVDFETDKASGRTTAGYADFIQMSGCKGLIDISDCTFSNPHDDPINVHGTFLQVIGINDDRTEVTVQYKHHETAGFPNYYKGDKVEFSTRGNMVPVSENGQVAVREVVKVDGPDGKGGKGSLNDLTKIKLTFDKPIPAEITANNSHVVENITYTPEVKIHDNIFKETPTRGVLCTTRGKVEITDNMFDNMGMAAIYISNDAQSWYESGRTTDVTIKGNTFIVNPLTAGAAGIFVQPTNGNVNGTVHENMKIEDNTFFMAQSQNVLNAKCVENLTFKNNKVYRQNPDVTVSAKADKTNLAAGESSSITVTADGAEFGAKAYRFEGCKNVTIEGNTYDGGLNAGAELASTEKNQVTVKNDVAKVGADNKLNKVGTIFYKSSDDKVVKVSASGVVTAVGNGTADVTAYAVAGGRKFEAAPITYTVEGEATVQPTAIKITTNQEKLTDQTLQYTAEVTAEDGVDKAVTWSVVDPTTGQATDKAAIDETSGLLTAEKSGAVEVVAKTKNGLEARKLLSIQVGEVVLAEGIEIQGENKERWNVEGENRIHVKSTPGGTFNTQTPANWFKVPVDNNTTEVSLKIEGKTAVEWEDVGLYLGKDEDNYVAIQRKHRAGTLEQLGMVNEMNGNVSNGNEQLGGIDEQSSESLYFKLTRDGNKVKSAYSTDGQTWKDFGNEVTNTTFMPDSNGQLYVAFGAMGKGDTEYVFTDLKVNNKPVALTQSVSDNLPSVSEVSVAYTEAENKLTASYKLGEGSDKIVKWAVSSEENGFYSVLEANTGDTLTATPDMKNKYVKAVVVPVKDSGVSGDIVWSSQAVKVTGEGLDAGNAKSANARLAKADITGLTKGFEFDKNTLTYLTTATTEEKKLNVEFAAEDKNAKVETVFNDKTVKDNKGELTLTSGRNLIEVTVTAEDGITKKYYRFTIFRDGDDNAKLTSLKVDGQTVELKDDVYEYRVDVNKAKEVALEAVANASAKVAMSFDGKVVKDNKVTLQPGSNMVNIIVTPETSAEPTRYAVNIKVPDPTNANLESVVFSDNVKLDKKFEKTTTEYTGIATSSAITIDVTAEEKDATVKVTVNGKEQKELKKVKLVEGDNTIVIEVTSPDKKQKKTYTFKLEGKSVIYLSDLEHKNNSTNGWSNKPFGMDKTYEGNPIRLVEDEEQNIRTFEKGVWSHATANIYYDLENKGYKEFETYVGVDAAQLGKPGSVTFKVFIDEQEVFTSTKEMVPEDIMQHVKVTIPEGAKELHLQALMGASDSNDHADWADAKFVTAFDGGEEPSVPVESVAVTADKKELKVGETAQATAIVTPDNATNKEVTWSVSDENVLSVSEDGKVTAKAKGTAEVIATAENGVSGKVTIEVTEKDIPVEPDKADKSGLQELVDKYSELKEKDYTADSWKGYQEAMDTAKKVLADKNATQEEVDAASTALKNAVDKLVKVDEQKKPEQKPSDSNKDKNQEKPVKTGDTMTVLPVAVLMAACVAVVAVFVRKKRKGAAKPM